MSWQEWFEKWGGETSIAREYRVDGYVQFAEEVTTHEEMYQAFKERIKAELAVEAPDLRTLGILVDLPSILKDQAE